MKLTWKRITAHTKYPFRIARAGGSVSDDDTLVEQIVVSIEHAGVVGLGEAVPAPYYHQSLDSVEQTLEKAYPVLGDDPGDIDAIIDRLLERFDDQRATVAAIDAALHDWLGKRRGEPVWRILGLSPSKTPPTSMTVGIDTPEVTADKVKELHEFRVIKVKVGRDRDVETLKAIRAAAGDRKIRIDANCGWSPDNAVERMRALLPFDLELIEQPVPTGQLNVVRELSGQSPIPIVADEDAVQPSDVERLADAYDGINVKLSKCGGIREGMRMIQLARQRGMKVMLGCMVETSLGISAIAQLGSLADFADLDGHLLLADDPFEGLVLRDGVVRPGDGPGLGVHARSSETRDYR